MIKKGKSEKNLRKKRKFCYMQLSDTLIISFVILKALYKQSSSKSKSWVKRCGLVRNARKLKLTLADSLESANFFNIWNIHYTIHTPYYWLLLIQYLELLNSSFVSSPFAIKNKNAYWICPAGDCHKLCLYSINLIAKLGIAIATYRKLKLDRWILSMHNSVE